MGFDGSVCNEHHNNVLSMQESVNNSAAVISQRIKGTIALIGNPLPIHDNPVRVAEEIAMLDRLTHHVHILELNGDSYRLKQSKRRQRQPQAAELSDNKPQA